jgi:hypothetical protein
MAVAAIASQSIIALLSIQMDATPTTPPDIYNLAAQRLKGMPVDW